MFDSIQKALRTRFGRDKFYYRMVDELFGFLPNNIELYKLALIHRSASVPLARGGVINNERLEFLGDSILAAIVSDYLFIEYREANEGSLTKLRSKIVSRSTLNTLSQSIGIDRYIVSQPTGNFTNKHIYGDALEAFIGAIYLDKGFEFVNRLIITDILPEYLDMDNVSTVETDYKSRLIEWCQKSKRSIVFRSTPSSESTSAHPVFRSVVIIDGCEIGYGNGDSKKEAEQHASYSISRLLSDEMGDMLLNIMDNKSENEL